MELISVSISCSQLRNASAHQKRFHHLVTSQLSPACGRINQIEHTARSSQSLLGLLVTVRLLNARGIITTATCEQAPSP